MERTEAMHVAGPTVTHAGAEPGNPYREIRRQRRALGPPFRVLVCVHELGGLNLHVFGNEASPCPGNAGGTDDQELAKTRAVARQLHDMPCPLRVDRVQIGQRRGEARVRRGVNDDIDVLSQAIRHIGIEHHPLAAYVPVDGNHATFRAMQERFGNDELIQLTTAIGYYSMLCMTVNACELEAGAGAEVLKV